MQYFSNTIFSKAVCRDISKVRNELADVIPINASPSTMGAKNFPISSSKLINSTIPKIPPIIERISLPRNASSG